MASSFIRRCLNLFYPLVKKVLPFPVYAYLAVGGANTAFNILLFTVIYVVVDHSAYLEVAGFNLRLLAVEIATVISFLATVITGFWLNKNFAFAGASDEKKERTWQFGKYFLVSLQGQFSDYLITKGLILFLLIHPTLSYLISTVIMLTVTYFLQKYYTFKAKKITSA